MTFSEETVPFSDEENLGVEENLGDEENLGEDKVEESVGESDSEMLEEGVPNVSPPLNMGLTKKLSTGSEMNFFMRVPSGD